MATNALYNVGTSSFMDDPYQAKVMRAQLQQAGLWKPEWDQWFNDQQESVQAPDLSSLAGYQVGYGDQGGGYRRADLIGPGGVVVDNPYFYDEPSMGEQAVEGGLIVGGAALGMNALGGAMGGAAGSGGMATTGAYTGMPELTASMLPSTSATLGGGGLSSTAAGLSAGGGASLTGGFGALTGGAAEAGAAGYGGLSGAVGGAGAGGGLWNTLTSPNSLAQLGSAAIGLYGQNKAAGAMQDATNQANEFNRYAFDSIRADNKPLVDMRNSVLPQIQGLLSNPGSITSDPGYAFQFNEGQKALNNGAAARGMTYSGAQGKALTRYGNDYASTKLDQSLNRLTNVAGLGQVGSNSNNAATSGFAANASNNALGMGGARGSVYGNMANIGGNALSGIFNQWQDYQLNGRPG